MRKHKIVAVIWEDHLQVVRNRVVDNPHSILTPTLSVGILYKETDKVLVLVSDIERYSDHDDATYTIIFKSSIASIKEFGKIKLRKLR